MSNRDRTQYAHHVPIFHKVHEWKKLVSYQIVTEEGIYLKSALEAGDGITLDDFDFYLETMVVYVIFSADAEGNLIVQSYLPPYPKNQFDAEIRGASIDGTTLLSSDLIQVLEWVTNSNFPSLNIPVMELSEEALLQQVDYSWMVPQSIEEAF